MVPDEPDRELNCVGYWMEDMRSYMVTYDEEDAVTQFRCWVCHYGITGYCSFEMFSVCIIILQCISSDHQCLL